MYNLCNKWIYKFAVTQPNPNFSKIQSLLIMSSGAQESASCPVYYCQFSCAVVSIAFSCLEGLTT